MLGATSTSGAVALRQLDVAGTAARTPSARSRARAPASAADTRAAGTSPPAPARSLIPPWKPLHRRAARRAARVSFISRRPRRSPLVSTGSARPPHRPSRAASAAAAPRTRRTASPARAPDTRAGSASPAARPACSAASAGASGEDVADHDVRPKLLQQRHQRQRRVGRRRPLRRPGAGGGKVLYSSAAVNPRPSASTASRQRSQVSTSTSCPRRRSARASAIAGNACPASPNAATRNLARPHCNPRCARPPLARARAPRRAIPSPMRRRDRNPAERLRFAVEACRAAPGRRCCAASTPTRSSSAPTSTATGGICPMLAAHRNGGRTSLASFARAWDRYTGAKRPRRGDPPRGRARSRSLLESSLDRGDLDAARLDRRGGRPDPRRARRARGARRARRRSAPPGHRRAPPRRELRDRLHWSWMRPARRYDEFRDLLAAAEEQLAEQRAAELLEDRPAERLA